MNELTHKVYIGRRLEIGNCQVAIHYPNGDVRELKQRQDLINHSPDGFEWGYRGSGPAQLALAILCDALCDDDVAMQYHQEFKEAFVSEIHGQAFKITHVAVLDIFLALKADCEKVL